MAEQTYLYSYGSGPWGASATRRTRAYIEAQTIFAKMDPELRRRLFGLANEVIRRGSDFGFGGGWRDAQQQLNLFLSRYDRYSTYPGGSAFWWDGRPTWNYYGWWIKKPNVAPSAPPGRSYHESTTTSGLCLAADMVGDHALANSLAPTFGLRHFGNINGEPWHYQPVEIPNARINYRNETLNYWNIPGEGNQMIASNFQFDKRRIIDTRQLGGRTNPAGQVLTFDAPAGAVGVKINITAVDALGNGFVIAYPAGTNMPGTSDLNYTPNLALCNQIDVPTNGGKYSLFVLNATHIIVDQVGFWF